MKEMAWLQACAKPRFPIDRIYREFINHERSQPDEHLRSLEDYLKVAQHLIPKEDWLCKPTLRHPDLQPKNIFVSEDFDIVSLIDWQHCSVLPLFLQAGIPKYFQNYGDPETEAFTVPKLPDDFADLDEEDQQYTLEQYRKRHLHFYYLGITSRNNNPHFRACAKEYGLFKRKPLLHASDPWEGNNIPLKAELVSVTQPWPDLTKGTLDDPAPPCPITFDEEEAQDCLRIEALQEDIDTDLERFREAIGISIDGRTSNDHYEDAVAQAAFLKAKTIGNAEDGHEREVTEALWPFDDHDEKERVGVSTWDASSIREDSSEESSFHY